jgi:hypothetical protein
MSVTRSRRLSRKQLARRKITRKNYRRKGTVRIFTCKHRARRGVVCKKLGAKQHGGVGIQEEEVARDPVIAYIGGVPVATLEGTLKKIDRFEGDVVID